jgi:hypothetical protein
MIEQRIRNGRSVALGLLQPVQCQFLWQRLLWFLLFRFLFVRRRISGMERLFESIIYCQATKLHHCEFLALCSW